MMLIANLWQKLKSVFQKPQQEVFPERARAVEQLLKIPHIEDYLKLLDDDPMYERFALKESSYAYLIILVDNYFQYVIRVSKDGRACFLEYDVGGYLYFKKHVSPDIVMKNIHRETTKALCFHLDLFT